MTPHRHRRKHQAGIAVFRRKKRKPQIACLAGKAGDLGVKNLTLMFVPRFELMLEARYRSEVPGKRVGGIVMTTKLASAVCALSLVFCGSAAAVDTASAQAQSVPAPPLAGPPSPEQVQPWGLPPPPPGIGPVTLFADIHDQPHGKFLEGGAFDTAGNF